MSRKILLVEDEAPVAMNEARMLKKHGYEVVTAYSGEKAIEAVNSDPKISLILMDIDLGQGIDGTEAAEKILEDHDLPVAFLSSHTEAEVVEKTEGITSYGYILKNSGETVLLASIRMAFRLWESDDKFRKAFEYTSVGMVLTSPAGELFRVNEAFASMLGYLPAEINSVNFSKLTHPEDVEMSVEKMKTMIEGKTDRSRFTKRYIRKNGGIVWADINTMLLRDSEGTPLHFVTHAQDITESKLMQEELDRQREQYDLLLRSAPTPILVMQNGKYVYSNPFAAHLLGYTSSRELLGTPVRQTISDESLKKIEERMSAIEGGRKNPVEEITILRRDGKSLCCESTSIPITFNSLPAGLIIGRDLTTQKQVEEALKESRDKIASILRAAPTGIGVVQGTEKRTIVEANDKLCSMTGYSREELLGTPARDLYPTQEDYDYVGLEKYRQIEKAGSGSVETRWKKKDGTVIDVLLASTPIHPSDISHGVTFTAMDITEHKRAQTELHEKEALYRSLMENSIDAVYLLSETGKVLQVNHNACTMLGYSNKELLQLTIDDIDINYPSRRFIEFWNNKPEGTTVLFETTHIHKNGGRIPVEVNGIFFKLDGEKFLFGVARDLTERKRQEEELKRSEEKYRLLFTYSNDAIFVHEIGEDKLPGKNIQVNEQASRLLGYTREELLDISAQDVMPEKHASSMFIHGQELMKKRHLTFETENIRSDGVVIPIEVSAYLYTEGDTRYVVSSVRDITERKRLEEELQKSKDRYKTIFYNSEVSLWEENFAKTREKIDELKQKGVEDFNEYLDSHPEMIWDLAGGIEVIDINDATLRLYEADSKEELLGSLDKTLYLTDDTYTILKDEYLAIAEGRTSVHGEMKTKTLNGAVLNIMMNVYISKEKDIMLVAISDITPYKKALAEKDYLMKELNHRVKNNLNMVSSLISLKDLETDCDLSDLKHRIDTIKLVHEKLNQHDDLEKIEVKEYFQELLTSVFSASYSQTVDIINNIEDVNVPTKTAIPLGLVVNEIATNAIKYGFTSGEAARFTVTLSKEHEGRQYILTLSNTGNPFPENVEMENPETLGLQLVSTLVAQLNGTIELQKSPNPVFTIRFPVGEG